MRIWKFRLPIEDEPYIVMPRGAKVLSVQAQGNHPFVWALVDEKERLAERHWFFVLGTGNPIDWDMGESTFLGTFQLDGGALVFHVFDNGAVELHGITETTRGTDDAG